MQLILLLMLISSGCSHKVVDSVEDLSPEHFNTTLLKPVPRATNSSEEKASSASTWKIATSLIDTKDDNLNTSKERQTDHSNSGESPTTSKPENASSSEFRPSPHVGSFLDDDNLVVPTRQPFGPFSPVIRRPPPGFFSTYKDDRWSPFNKFPEEMFKHHEETPILTPKAKHHEDWRPSSPSQLDSKPTAGTPVGAVPAPILYHSFGSFKHKPDVFGVDFHGDLREVAFKKPPPWSGMMRMLAALVPVGIIVSALSPSVLRIDTTGNNNKPIDNNIFRRGDLLPNAAGADQPVSGDGNLLGHSPPTRGSNLLGPGLTGSGSNLLGHLPPMSERCRRRLLCELQADHNYQRAVGNAGCGRMRCEDPAGLRVALDRLLHAPRA